MTKKDECAFQECTHSMRKISKSGMGGRGMCREKYRLALLRKTLPMEVGEVRGKLQFCSMLRNSKDSLGF